MSYKSRKRLAILILLMGLPLYVIVAVNVVELFGRPTFVVELLIWVVLGIAWALPLKAVFRGIGQPDPDARSDGD